MRVACPVDVFCRNAILREELLALYPDAKLKEGMGLFAGEELIAWLKGFDAAIIGREIINDRILDALPDLKIIGKFGVGCDSIDFASLRRHGVRWGYEGGVNSRSVAELALCFAITGLRGVTSVNLQIRAGNRPRQNIGRHLTGRVFGIHGCGNVGKELVQLLAPFDCRILVTDIQDYPEFFAKHRVERVPFERLIAESEVLSLHLPLTRQSRSLYDRDALTRLKSDCVLINTARGEIVDENALCDLLEQGHLAAACFDVFAVEPPENDRLLRLPNFLATPHIGASAEEARVAMGRAAIRALFNNAVPDPSLWPDPGDLP
jgi:phosphoglycerate dehydrogenase-like enzyme